MSDDHNTLRNIAWKDLCPWFLILRVFRLALSPSVLLLASLGTLLTPIGWGLAEKLLGEQEAAPPAIMVFPALDCPLLDWSDVPQMRPAELVTQAWHTNVGGVYALFAQPLTQMLDRQATFRGFTHGALVGLWNLAVWALFAGAITRIAVVQLGRDERVGLRDSLQFALQRYGWNVAAPLFPLAGVVACVIPMAILGALMRFDVGVLLGGLLWGLALLAGLIMAVFLISLALGWPLMWPAISCEESGDAFEAFSRSFAYTLHRPLNYLLYAAITVGIGLIGWLLVWAFASVTMETTYWAASWGAGSARVEQIAAGLQDKSGLLWCGTGLIRCCELVVRVLATGFNHAFFWCAASAVYLCLRRDVDRTEFDEVFLPEEQHGSPLPSPHIAPAPASDTVASSSTGIGAEAAGDAASDTPSDVN